MNHDKSQSDVNGTFRAAILPSASKTFTGTS